MEVVVVVVDVQRFLLLHFSRHFVYHSQTLLASIRNHFHPLTKTRTKTSRRRCRLLSDSQVLPSSSSSSNRRPVVVLVFGAHWAIKLEQHPNTDRDIVRWPPPPPPLLPLSPFTLLSISLSPSPLFVSRKRQSRLKEKGALPLCCLCLFVVRPTSLTNQKLLHNIGWH